MQTAYVLISRDPEDIEGIITMLNTISNISEANRVEGPYDILVKINAECHESEKKSYQFNCEG